ncbi:hypothetical protein LINPERHAP1_LOCUS16076, partial [Linum perenne]
RRPTTLHFNSPPPPSPTAAAHSPSLFQSKRALEQPIRSFAAPVLRKPSFQRFSPIPPNPFTFCIHGFKEHL